MASSYATPTAPGAQSAMPIVRGPTIGSIVPGTHCPRRPLSEAPSPEAPSPATPSYAIPIVPCANRIR